MDRQRDRSAPRRVVGLSGRAGVAPITGTRPRHRRSTPWRGCFAFGLIDPQKGDSALNITTTIDGTTAHIHARGEVDIDTLPPLRAAAAALPPQVTHLQWDLTGTPFMDVAGLHLLFAPTAGSTDCRTTVTGLARQPLWLLHTAACVNPAVFDLSRLLPDNAGQPEPCPPFQPCP